MTTPTDDYYDLIGVAPSAPTDEIRERYRERRSELDARGTDDARAEAARLNRAWNVLSDPYQRGRYDAKREGTTEEVSSDEIEVVDETAPPPRRRRLFDTSPRAKREAPLPAVDITYEGGYHAPENRRRIVAMVSDLFVLLLLFILAQFVVQAVVKERHPVEVHQLNRLNDQIDAAETKESDLNKRADTASQKVSDIEAKTAQGDLASAREAEAAAKRAADTQHKRVENLKDDAVEIQKKFTGDYYAVVGAFVLVSLAYLVVPSALTGQTLGKRVQHIRALRADGTPLGWIGALKRYAPIVILTGVFLPTAVGQIVFVIGLVVVLGWMRNAKRQGFHDRLAGTIVVDAS